MSNQLNIAMVNKSLKTLVVDLESSKDCNIKKNQTGVGFLLVKHITVT